MKSGILDIFVEDMIANWLILALTTIQGFGSKAFISRTYVRKLSSPLIWRVEANAGLSSNIRLGSRKGTCSVAAVPRFQECHATWD